MEHLCNHDVHHFANGVTLVRVGPEYAQDISPLQWAPYDRGPGVIVVERGTGRLLGAGAAMGEPFNMLRRSVEGLL